MYSGGVGELEETRAMSEAGPDAASETRRSGVDAMDALLAEVAAAPPVSLARDDVSIMPGTLVDQTYRVERRLGGGGMGVVYLAEHVELQRRVALKLHLGDYTSQELARLRREARVMARLSHPNVLTVHGVGEHQGRMFIAMEYAEQGTLKRWLKAAPRGWRAVTAMLVEAGRGLAAAHRVGVVHRDFKPDNVLLAADGRPQVADFGLARRWDDPMDAPTGPGPAAPLEDARRFTITGAVMGTPAYMSPEQFDGMEIGPASDQFSFCVVLYEALAGQRPFSGRSTLELAEAVHTGHPRPMPPGVRIPGALRRLVERGLRPLPGDRHPSVAALVDALERLLGARRRWAQAGVLGGAVLVAVAVGNRATVMASPEPCEGVEQGFGEAWSPARREAVATAMAPLPVPRRDELLGLIDDYARRWGAERREVCEATRVRDEQSEVVFGLRNACLDRMAGRLEGLTAELSQAELGAAPLSAEDITASLPALAPCEDVTALETLENRLASRSSRDSAEQDRAWVRAGALLARADTRHRLGLAGSLALAQQAAALAEEHHLPLVESAALERIAEARAVEGKAEEAAALHDKALRLAMLEGSDEAAADLTLEQAEAAITAGQLDEAAVHLGYHGAFAARLRDAERRDAYRHRSQLVEGRLALARAEHARAIALLTPTAEDPTADPLLRRAALMNLGTAYSKQGEGARALETWERLVALLVTLRGPNDPDQAAVLNNMASVRISRGDYEGALDDLGRASLILHETVGEEHPLYTMVLGNQGRAERRRGRAEEARRLQERSLALRQVVYGEEHPALAYPLQELGELARDRGDHSDALRLLRRAQRLREQALGLNHPLVAETLTRIAQVHLETRAQPRARELLERALQSQRRPDVDPVERARTELLLARATVDQQPALARELAEAARDRAAAAAPAGQQVLRDAERWLRGQAQDSRGVPAP